MLISSPRERFSLSPALVFWYPNTSHKKFLFRPHFGFLFLEVGYDIIPHSPLGNPVDIVELGKRLFSRSFRKKEPVSPDTLAHSNSNLKDLRTALLFALGFYGLFRINELPDLQFSDVTVHNDYLEILLKCSKTDQYREGNKVFISKIGGINCPYVLIGCFFDCVRVNRNSSLYNFGVLRFLKNSNSYALCSRRLSYTRARELINERLSAIGVDSRDFSTYRLRAGGVVFFAQNLPSSDARTDYLCSTVARNP